VGFDELFSQLLLGRAGVGGGVGHDETGAAFFVKCRVEELNPEIIRIVGPREAERIAADVEGWIGEDKIKAAGAL
jgi:hypothetical protein